MTVLVVLQAGCGGGSSSGVPGSPNGQNPARFVPNYAGESDPLTNQPNRLMHWGGFPLRVHFIADANLTNERQTLAANGFNWWAETFGGELKIETVNDPSAAHISVRFAAEGMASYSGTTQYSYTGDSRLVSAAITFNLSHLGNAAYIPPTAAHEFGHALGIGGHSADRLDLMATAPNVLSLVGPTLRDENTMKTAYVGVLDELGRAGSERGALHSGSISCILAH